MNTFGPPQRVLVRGEGLLRLGRRRSSLPRPPRRHRRQRPRPRPSGRACGGDLAAGHAWVMSRTSSPRRRRSPWPSDCSHCSVRTGRVFFTNSGTEANEAAFKATRRTGRTKIISTIGAFHGRSMGALALTWKPGYREPFEPLPGRRRVRPVRRRSCARRGGRQPDRSRHPRTDPGGERRHRATCGLPRRGAPDHRASTAPCSGSTRCRPGSVGPAAGSRHSRQRRRARPGDAGEGARARASPSAPASVSATSANLLGPGRPRHDVRRQPGGGDGGPRNPRRDRAGRPARARRPRSANTWLGRLHRAGSSADRSRQRTRTPARDPVERRDRAAGRQGRPRRRGSSSMRLPRRRSGWRHR